jgi:lipopolysaccharide transport system permease protein
MLVVGAVKAPTNYELIIQPSRGWLTIHWDELWEFRDLLVLLVQRDFISRYKQTILGPLWFLLQPVIMALFFVVIFARIAQIPTDNIPTPLFYLCNLLGWNYFSQNITTGGATFINNSHLFGKVYFPRLIVPISIVVANIISFGLQLIPFLAFLAYYKLFSNQAAAITLSWQVLLIPLPLFHIAVLSLAVSLLMSASTAKYRDLFHLNQFIVQLWMFGTPIIYPLSKVPAQWEWLVQLNPMTMPVEAFRLFLLGHGTLHPSAVVTSLAITILLLIAGLAAFQKVERTVVDSV